MFNKELAMGHESREMHGTSDTLTLVTVPLWLAINDTNLTPASCNGFLQHAQGLEMKKYRYKKPTTNNMCKPTC